MQDKGWFQDQARPTACSLVYSLGLSLQWGGEGWLQALDVQSLRSLLGSKGARGRWLTSSNRTTPFISPPRLAPLALAATVPQSQGERHQTRHQNVPSTVRAMGVGRMHLSPGRFLLGSMGGVRVRAATSLGKASGLKAQGGHHLEVKDSIA